MPPMSPERRRLRARIARASRGDQASTENPAELRRELKAVNAAEYIRRLVDTAPPLTDEERRRLAAILTPGDTCSCPSP